MSDNVIEVVEVGDDIPIRHQFGKLLFATIVAFAATKLAESTYDFALDAYRRRHGL
jgi:hypothetical protein